MAIDYSDRQIPGRVTPNRPRKKSLGGVVLLSFVALFVSYILGLATGWFLFGQQPRPVTIAKPVPSQPPAQVPPPPTVQASQTPQAPAPGAPQTPSPPMPLTFYETLAKGERGVMGSGINSPPPKRDEGNKGTTPPAVPKPDQTKPSEQPKQKVESQKRDDTPPRPRENAEQQHARPQTADERLKPVVPGKEQARGYTVQIASTADRGEAESLRKRLEARGIAAYVSTFDKQGKSWYRIRSGHAMTESAAKALAATIGGGAIVVPE